MGLFDRFRSTVPTDSIVATPTHAEEEATRLIEHGHTLEAQGRLDDALQCYLDAIRLAPNPARAHLNRGNVLLLKGDLEGALDAFRTAIQHKPDYAGAYYNIGNALLNQGRHEEAAANYRRALEIQPDYAEVHCVMGVALRELGQLDHALACFNQAILLNPDLVEAQLNLGSLLLSQGRYIEAWPKYEARQDNNYLGRQSIPPDLPYPKWHGEKLAGKSILIWPEQGYGDQIQFSRFIPQLKILGASHITLVCRPPLKVLLESLEGVDSVVSLSELDTLQSHDYWTFPLSLPLHFSTTVETIPSRMPYLKATPERLDKWRDRLPPARLKVGLVWKGNADPNPHRSMPGLDTLASLWSVPGISFISLQKGPGEEEAISPPASQPLCHLGSDIMDFADCAAIIEQLHLVICIDTAIAHLVGALHKPCWVLLPAFGVDWRWFNDRNDSPWYPGQMRLFRQTKTGGWPDIIEQVRKALQIWADEHSKHM